MPDEDTPLLSPSSHRLPTVSATQALQSLHASGARTVSTGIVQLDKILAPPSLPGHHVLGGYMRGKVTEIFGPSGSGKTAFGIQAAVSALRQGNSVFWIDAACAPLVKQRFDTFFPTSNDCFDYIVAPTLAHLLAMLMHSPASFPRKNASLIVIDSLSTLLDNAYPRNSDDRTTKPKTDQSRWAAGRRYTVINDLMATLTRFAAQHDVALLITCQTITRIRGASRALLGPAILGTEWENGIFTRLVLFRDWVRREMRFEEEDADRLRKIRFAGLLKANGVMLANEGGVGIVVPFAIEHSGLCDVRIPSDEVTTPKLLPIQERPPKRPFSEVDEDADEDHSSDELYGWVEDDQVATEGLLIDEALVVGDRNNAASLPDKYTESRDKKVTRTSTV